jgi:N-carbamoyl-L-amino-acid hydrolase
MMFVCSKEEVMKKIETFSRFGAGGTGGITRFSLTPAAILARKEFARRMEELGCKILTDDMANMYATVPGARPDLPRIVMGSHVDSVRNGGNYDGILGVIAAMQVAETLVRDRIPHRHPFTAMIWTNEEGSWYPPPMMSSGVICGKYKKETVLASRNPEGNTFGEALKASGFAGSETNRLNSRDYIAMVELHIEQGPVLETAKKQIGVVLGVLGAVHYRISVRGQANHTGTIHMSCRKDALLAAMDTLRYLHTELNKLDKDILYTTGELNVYPNIHSVIPGHVEFTLDIRHQDHKVTEKAAEVVKGLPKEFDHCEINWREAWSRKAVLFDGDITAAAEKSVRGLGYPFMTMYSGAGHDAQYTADLLPTGMIFVPSKDGRSHCEEEFTTLEEAWQGINVALNTVLELDKK